MVCDGCGRQLEFGPRTQLHGTLQTTQTQTSNLHLQVANVYHLHCSAHCHCHWSLQSGPVYILQCRTYIYELCCTAAGNLLWHGWSPSKYGVIPKYWDFSPSSPSYFPACIHIHSASSPPTNQPTNQTTNQLSKKQKTKTSQPTSQLSKLNSRKCLTTVHEEFSAGDVLNL